MVGFPQNGWFIMENPIFKWVIWGYHRFRKPPYMYCRCIMYTVYSLFLHGCVCTIFFFCAFFVYSFKSSQQTSTNQTVTNSKTCL